MLLFPRADGTASDFFSMMLLQAIERNHPPAALSPPLLPIKSPMAIFQVPENFPKIWVDLAATQCSLGFAVAGLNGGAW